MAKQRLKDKPEILQKAARIMLLIILIPGALILGFITLLSFISYVGNFFPDLLYGMLSLLGIVVIVLIIVFSFKNNLVGAIIFWSAASGYLILFIVNLFVFGWSDLLSWTLIWLLPELGIVGMGFLFYLPWKWGVQQQKNEMKK